jgi:hypothetical protein
LEADRVLGIIELINTCGIHTAIRRSDTAPQLVLRLLRESDEVVASIDQKHVCQHLITQLKGCCQGTGRELEFRPGDQRISPSDLISSWSLRPFPGLSDANHRWSPLSSFLSPGDSVLIVGIGSGGIMQCIPQSCFVNGLDLPSSFSACGQDYTTYQPAFFHPNYQTLSMSWLRRFDLEDYFDREEIAMRVSHYDVVVIDVERVSTSARLQLRHVIATQGPRCWVRCHDTHENIHEIHRSVCSLRQLKDRTWTPEISMGTEIILGSSASPLGLFKALGTCVPEEVPPCTDKAHDQSGHLSKKLCLFQIGADPNLSDENIRDFLCRDRATPGKSLILELFDFQGGDLGVMRRLGRQKLRCVEYLSRYL